MSCERCGTQTPNRLCAQCSTIERLENENDGIGNPVDGSFPDDGRDYINTQDCRAIISSSGEQCTNSKRDSGLCGNHEKANNVTQVDDVPGAPFADLRDALVDAGMNGVHAYRLATRFQTAPDLWRALTGLETLEIGDKRYDADALASHAEDVAKLDDVDAGDHPIAFENCIALTDSSKFDGKCVNGGYGTGLLCGTHKGANDPETTLDDADFPRVDGHGTDHLVVELRDDRAIVVDTEKWALERVYRDDVVEDLERCYDFDLEGVDEWRVYLDNTPPTGEQDVDQGAGGEPAVASDGGGERLVRCVECGNEWRSEADSPRCSDPNDECNRSRNVEPVDALEGDEQDVEPFDGPTWVLECSKCGTVFESRDRHADCSECGDVVGPHTTTGIAGDAPAALEGVDVDDRLEITLEETDRVFTGDVSEVSPGAWDTPVDGAAIGVYVRGVDEVDDCMILETEREHAGVDWSPVRAVDSAPTDDDRESRVDMGTVERVDVATDGGDQDEADVESITVTLNAGPSVDVEQLPPASVLEQYPNEKASDDPINDFFSDLASTVAERVGATLDELPIGATLGELHVDGSTWRFVEDDDLDSLVEDDGDQDGDDRDGEPEKPDGWIDPFKSEKRRDELEDAGLSGREAEVVAAKEQGLTHAQIADELDLPKSTVDEYSRRARGKVNDARALVDALDDTYV